MGSSENSQSLFVVRTGGVMSATSANIATVHRRGKSMSRRTGQNGTKKNETERGAADTLLMFPVKSNVKSVLLCWASKRI
jgi:hypothetical protein